MIRIMRLIYILVGKGAINKAFNVGADRTCYLV